jgi:hypothetical protein
MLHTGNFIVAAFRSKHTKIWSQQAENKSVTGISAINQFQVSRGWRRILLCVKMPRFRVKSRKLERHMLISRLSRALSLLLCPAIGLAQTATPATIQVTSRIVYVDVVVHDSSGHLVHGLTQKEFQLAEDGKPQNIDYFVAHSYDLARRIRCLRLTRRMSFRMFPKAAPPGRSI